jgi:hypothetical protein
MVDKLQFFGTYEEAVTAEPRIQSRMTSCEVGDERSALEQVYSTSFFGFPMLISILPLLHTNLSLPPEMCDSCDRAANYHILGPLVGLFISGPALVAESEIKFTSATFRVR